MATTTSRPRNESLRHISSILNDLKESLDEIVESRKDESEKMAKEIEKLGMYRISNSEMWHKVFKKIVG